MAAALPSLAFSFLAAGLPAGAKGSSFASGLRVLFTHTPAKSETFSSSWKKGQLWGGAEQSSPCQGWTALGQGGLMGACRRVMNLLHDNPLATDGEEVLGPPSSNHAFAPCS